MLHEQIHLTGNFSPVRARDAEESVIFTNGRIGNYQIRVLKIRLPMATQAKGFDMDILQSGDRIAQLGGARGVRNDDTGALPSHKPCGRNAAAEGPQSHYYHTSSPHVHRTNLHVWARGTIVGLGCFRSSPVT